MKNIDYNPNREFAYSEKVPKHLKINDKTYTRLLSTPFSELYDANKIKSFLKSSHKDIKIVRTDRFFYCYGRKK